MEDYCPTELWDNVIFEHLDMIARKICLFVSKQFNVHIQRTELWPRVLILPESHMFLFGSPEQLLWMLDTYRVSRLPSYPFPEAYKRINHRSQNIWLRLASNPHVFTVDMLEKLEAHPCSGLSLFDLFLNSELIQTISLNLYAKEKFCILDYFYERHVLSTPAIWGLFITNIQELCSFSYEKCYWLRELIVRDEIQWHSFLHETAWTTGMSTIRANEAYTYILLGLVCIKPLNEQLMKNFAASHIHFAIWMALHYNPRFILSDDFLLELLSKSLWVTAYKKKYFNCDLSFVSRIRLDPRTTSVMLKQLDLLQAKIDTPMTVMQHIY